MIYTNKANFISSEIRRIVYLLLSQLRADEILLNNKHRRLHKLHKDEHADQTGSALYFFDIQPLEL
jgi:hypothetical protein